MADPAYQISTPRLVIRCWRPADAPLLKAALDDNLEHLRPWMDWAWDEPSPLPEIVGRLRKWRGLFDLDRDYFYGIFDPEESEVLGAAGLHTSRVAPGVREIGYWLRRDVTGRGLATEAAAGLTCAGFEVDRVARIEIHVAVQNTASNAVPERLGYTREAVLRQRLASREGPRRDVVVWTMLLDEYPDSPAAQVPVRAFGATGRHLT